MLGKPKHNIPWRNAFAEWSEILGYDADTCGLKSRLGYQMTEKKLSVSPEINENFFLIWEG